jgi:flagellar biosynthesis/type III secretory pathway chaperone
MSLKEPLAALIDTMIDLIRLMEEESEALAISGPRAAADALAQAKIRHMSNMETQCAALYRLNPDWMTVLQGDDWRSFRETAEELHLAAIVNSEILERQIALSSEMLVAVGKELERVTGRGGSTYSRHGSVKRKASRPPVSINGRF